jgi:hypothetical protein
MPIGKKVSNPELIFRTFRALSRKEMIEEQAEEYADIVAKSESSVTYTEAYDYYMKTRYYDKKENNDKTH